jgi:sphingolipid delta-4 desaturase
VKKLAPEFYDHLYAHRSLTRVLMQWIFNRDLDLFTRITRDRARAAAREAQAA